MALFRRASIIRVQSTHDTLRAYETSTPYLETDTYNRLWERWQWEERRFARVRTVACAAAKMAR